MAASSSKGGSKKQPPIRIKKSEEGSLHAALGVPQGKSIPAAKLAAAKKSPDPAIRKKANFAANAKSWKHTGSTKKGK